MCHIIPFFHREPSPERGSARPRLLSSDGPKPDGVCSPPEPASPQYSELLSLEFLNLCHGQRRSLCPKWSSSGVWTLNSAHSMNSVGFVGQLPCVLGLSPNQVFLAAGR